MIQIELGGGNNPLKYQYPNKLEYLNIDIIYNPRVDLCYDLRKGIPYQDAIISNIYSCEFLEHLTLDEVKRLLIECYRVLIPQGTLYVQCPNIDGICEVWLEGRSQPYLVRNILGDQSNIYDYHRSLIGKEWLMNYLQSINFSSVIDKSEEHLQQILNDSNELLELMARGVTPQDIIKIKIFVEAIK